MDDAFIGRHAVSLRISRLEEELKQIKDQLRYWNPIKQLLTQSTDPIFTHFFVQNTIAEKQQAYLRGIEITKEVDDIDEQLSKLDLLWLDEQRRTIAALGDEIEALKSQNKHKGIQIGQLKERIRQLDYELLPDHYQQLTDIVVINVPRAERSYKPVYVDGNPLCTYRRNGEGDYRCTKEEYQAMVRDASVKTQDMLILNEMDMTVFNKESIRSYRQRMRLSRPGHVWEALEDEDFLLKLGAVGIGSDGKKHPTSAGLLMFGNEYDIVREFNAYFLDYQEQYDADTRWTDRIISSSGDWSGNVYAVRFCVE